MPRTIIVISLASALATPVLANLDIFPRFSQLAGPESSQQLIVSRTIDSVRYDLTRRVSYSSSNPDVATVSDDGRIYPVGEGTVSISVEYDGVADSVDVTVHGVEAPQPISFRNQVEPILTKATCNSGGCHGKAEGQNGFKLSVFGFDAQADYLALTQEARGRRVDLASPSLSLLLKKATGEIPHGGGVKILPHSLWYRRLERWIDEGTLLDRQEMDDSFQLVVTPHDSILPTDGGQQLQVFAVDRLGQHRCVTPEVEYFSNDPVVAKVNADGWVQVGNVPGEAAILVRFLGQVAVSRVTLPQGDTFRRPSENNAVDRYVWDRLVRLGIKPSPVSEDSAFLRRVYLDTIGTLPTVEEATSFLANTNSNKRQQVIASLLERKEYGNFWAMKWADLLRIDHEIVRAQGTVAMTRWLRRQFNENRPYDQIVRDVISVRGNTHSESPAAFYTVHLEPEMLGRSVSQVFLGVRIECAQCHQHPFEQWGQQDYFAFSGFFTGVGRKGVLGGGTNIFDQPGKDLPHPRTNNPVATAGLGAKPVKLNSETDRRNELANWMTSPENPFLARMLVNRLWAHYFGRGLVDPVDDMRATNPPTNAPLMDFLSQQFVVSGFDIKEITKLIVSSQAYQLSSRVNDSNRLDRQNYSHAEWKTIPAEVLLDAISQVTRVPEDFNGWPSGYRAIEIWDNRMPSYFFRIFGKPQRVSVCECERGNEPSIAQALHLMNSPETMQKISHRHGRAAALANSSMSESEIIDHLYLAAVTRYPTDAESKLMLQAFTESGMSRRAASEDIMWTLINTREFVFNH